MQVSQGNLFMRDDTFLGVCEAIGEDFGINSNLVRVAFAVPLLLNPPVVLGAYLGVGILVAFTRLLVRNPRPSVPAQDSRVGEIATVEEHDESVGAETQDLAVAA